MRLVFYPSYQEYRLSNLLQSAEHHLDLLPCTTLQHILHTKIHVAS